MKDTGSLHLKVQEHCDCFATTDPLSEMSRVKNDTDKEDAAIKWLALAALHGVNNGAEKIVLQKEKDGTATVTVKYKKAELPSPGTAVAEKIFEAVRAITHIEKDEGKSQLALGIRDSSIDLKVEIEKEDDGDCLEIKFP
jgi:hypothetical protein